MDRHEMVRNLLSYFIARREPAALAYEDGEPVVLLRAPRPPLPPLTGPIPEARFVEVNPDGTATLEIRL